MGTSGWQQSAVSTRSVSGCGQVAGSSQHGLSQDVDKWLAAVSSQHGLSQDVVKRLAAVRSWHGLSQVVDKWLAAVSSQHGLSQDVDKWLAAVSTVCLRMGTTWKHQPARSV